jgi:hypothetical protein
MLTRVAVAVAVLALFPAIGAAQQPARQRPQATAGQAQQRVERLTERLATLKASQQERRGTRGQMADPGQRRAAVRAHRRGQFQIQRIQRQLRHLRRQIR